MTQLRLVVQALLSMFRFKPRMHGRGGGGRTLMEGRSKRSPLEQEKSNFRQKSKKIRIVVLPEPLINDISETAMSEARSHPVVEIDRIQAGGVEDALARDELQQHHAERVHVAGHCQLIGAEVVGIDVAHCAQRSRGHMRVELGRDL